MLHGKVPRGSTCLSMRTCEQRPRVLPAPPAQGCLPGKHPTRKKCPSVTGGLRHVRSQEYPCVHTWERPPCFGSGVVTGRPSKAPSWLVFWYLGQITERICLTIPVQWQIPWCISHNCSNLAVFKHSLLRLPYLQIKNMTFISEIKELFFSPYTSSLCVFN